MKEIERIGLLKMDFLGLSTLTLLDDAVKHIKETTGDDDRPRAAAARRREDVSALPERPDARRVPVRELGHARHAAQGQAAVSRGSDRAERALPARARCAAASSTTTSPASTAASRSSTTLPQMEPVLKETYGVIAYQEQVMRLASELAGLHARPGRRAAPRDGQEGRREDAGAARRLHERLPRARHPREEGDQDLRVHRVLRRLRLQQVALDDLRAARVSDRRTSRRTTRATSWRRC